MRGLGWVVVAAMAMGCAERVVAMDVIDGEGCITYAPAQGEQSSGAWINDAPAVLELTWTWLGNPERNREWKLDQPDGAGVATSDATTDREGRLALTLDGTEDWSAGFRDPREEWHADHFVTMRSITPDETAILCVGHREPTGEARVAQRGTSEAFEVLAHNAEGLDVTVTIQAHTHVNLFPNEIRDLAQETGTIADGRAVLHWDVPGGIVHLGDWFEAHVQLMDPQGPVGDVHVQEILVGG